MPSLSTQFLYRTLHGSSSCNHLQQHVFWPWKFDAELGLGLSDGKAVLRSVPSSVGTRNPKSTTIQVSLYLDP